MRIVTELVGYLLMGVAPRVRPHPVEEIDGEGLDGEEMDVHSDLRDGDGD